VLTLFRDFLIVGQGLRPFRVRQYNVDNEVRPFFPHNSV
jgi:hypothetical protein